MAALYWRGKDPVGQRFQIKGRWAQVVGIAKNSKYRNLTEAAMPFFYIPMRQSLMGSNLQVRTEQGAEALAKQLVREIHKLDSNLAPGETITMQEQVDR